MITDNIIKIKLLDDYDAKETNLADVSLSFPFVNEKSTFSRYRAQLFYAPATTISSISLAIASGGDFPYYNLTSFLYYLLKYYIRFLIFILTCLIQFHYDYLFIILIVLKYCFLIVL